MLWPALVGRDEGKNDLRLCLCGELTLRFFGRLLETLQRHAISHQVDLVLFLELLHQPVDDQLVEIFAPEVRVATGGQHLVDTIAQLEDRDIEGASTEVVDGHLALRGFGHAVGERRGRRLVQNALDVEAGDSSGIPCCLPLRIVEVGRDGDDGLFHRLAEVVLSRCLELLEDDRRDLGRTVDLLVDLDMGVAVGRFDDRIGQNLVGLVDLGRIESTADESFHTVDGVLGIGQRLTLRNLPYQPLALARERHDGRSCARTFLVGDHLGRASLHDDDARVRRTEIDANYLAQLQTPCLRPLIPRRSLLYPLAHYLPRSLRGSRPHRSRRGSAQR